MKRLIRGRCKNPSCGAVVEVATIGGDSNEPFHLKDPIFRACNQCRELNRFEMSELYELPQSPLESMPPAAPASQPADIRSRTDTGLPDPEKQK